MERNYVTKERELRNKNSKLSLIVSNNDLKIYAEVFVPFGVVQ
jgi:hypothetical protein